MNIIRKTNLFNITDNNMPQQFITLSNYPESITASHLSVHSGLWPCGFIALYVPLLDENSKPKTDKETKDQMSVNYNRHLMFIRHIASHYENKMAFLRDYVSMNNDSVKKSDLCPLDYLLNSIYKFDSKTSIKYIGDITEQNYDSVWSDMFCTIDTSLCDCNYIINKTDENLSFIQYTNLPTKYLYGWCDLDNKYIGPDSWSDCKPIFDNMSGENEYFLSPSIKSITKEKTDIDTIKFNIIIPLYNLYNTDISVENSGSTGIINMSNNNNDMVIDFSTLYSNNSQSIHNLSDTFIPYGIWYSGVKPIILNKNTNIQTSSFAQPVWTLTLSSQFKAFPYTLRTDPTDKQINNIEINNKERTFAEILSAQNHIMDRFDEYNKQLSILQQEIQNLKNKS